MNQYASLLNRGRFHEIYNKFLILKRKSPEDCFMYSQNVAVQGKTHQPAIQKTPVSQ